MPVVADIEAAVKPAHFWCPPYAFTAGDEVAGLCADVGFAPDVNQCQALDVVFAENAEGYPAAFDVVVIGARQNIKTGLMKQCSIGWLWLLRVRRVLYTAHDWNPACADMFRDMKNLIDGSSLLSRRVRRIYEGNGEESIEFMSGAQMLFKTRTKHGGVGAGFDKVIWDEGFALQPVHVGSLTPTQATKRHAQNLTGSSAGHVQSTVLRELRDRGRPGGDPFVAYIEYCAPDPAEACDLGDECDHGKRTPGCGMDKPELQRLANPAVAAGRITLDFIAKERAKMSPREFGRERMGWWDPATTDGQAPAIEPDIVAGSEDPESAAAAVSAFGVDTAPDQSVTSIGVAGPRPDAATHLEFLQHGRGSAWLVQRCVQLDHKHGPAPFVLDAAGPAAAYADDMEAAGLTVVKANSREVAHACAQLVDGLRDGSAKWRSHPVLEQALVAARRRPRGEAFVFSRSKSAADITPLYAVALAKWLRDELNYDVMDSVY